MCLLEQCREFNFFFFCMFFSSGFELCTLLFFLILFFHNSVKIISNWKIYSEAVKPLFLPECKGQWLTCQTSRNDEMYNNNNCKLRKFRLYIAEHLFSFSFSLLLILSKFWSSSVYLLRCSMFF